MPKKFIFYLTVLDIYEKKFGSNALECIYTPPSARLVLRDKVVVTSRRVTRSFLGRI